MILAIYKNYLETTCSELAHFIRRRIAVVLQVKVTRKLRMGLRRSVSVCASIRKPPWGILT